MRFTTHTVDGPFLVKVGVLTTLLVVLLAPVKAGCPVRPGDRFCLVSARPVGCSTDPNRLVNGVYGAERVRNRWVTQDTVAMLASLDPTMPTIVYIHGNQIEANDARRRGLDVYHRLIQSSCDDRSTQFVVFSWASEKIPGLLRDFREKAARTRPVAAQLAWVLNRVPAGAPVGLLAYSYGTRVTSGAAHLLAGGSLSGLQLTEGGVARPIRAVFLAAAEDACWLSPSRYHGLAMQQIDTLLVTTNPTDPAMKYFKYVSKSSNPAALGGVGPRGLCAEASCRVQTRNVSGSVGRSHDLYRYMGAPGLMRSAWQRLTFADQGIESESSPTLAHR